MKRDAMRNLRSAGLNGLKFTAAAAFKGAEGIFLWARTDHSGMTRAMANLPSMGFIETLRCLLMASCVALGFGLLNAAVLYFTIVCWIPFLLSIIF